MREDMEVRTGVCIQWVTRQWRQERAVDTDPVNEAVRCTATEEISTGSLNVLFALWREGGVCRREFRTSKKMVRLLAAVKLLPPS